MQTVVGVRLRRKVYALLEPQSGVLLPIGPLKQNRESFLVPRPVVFDKYKN